MTTRRAMALTLASLVVLTISHNSIATGKTINSNSEQSLRMPDADDNNIKDSPEERESILLKWLGLEENFGYARLIKMKFDEAYRVKMYMKWNEHHKKAEDVVTNLKTLYHKRYRGLLLEYINKYQHSATTSDIARNRRVHFGEATVTKFSYQVEDTLRREGYLGRGPKGGGPAGRSILKKKTQQVKL
ncbi:hypothetical protein F444_03565 [Phytophthora nicotianae P1976]|uniref:Uncharacterized protein n=1 Tax=Phytophthora nicotianae P1976 TaxID=1317066 RepID=A0A081ATQ8_PHYNI|nr:hypothetical protein F444_03565 [Phytophthora nicotianae P1976]